MADAGRHLNNGRRRKKTPARKSRRGFDWRLDAPKILIALVLCLLMLSPLRSCMMQGERLSRGDAEKLVLHDARVKSDSAEDLSSEMIELDGEMCYRIEFFAADKDYSYIIAADDGAIIASSIHEK